MYEQINGTLAGQDLSYLLIYANQVTHNWFGLFMVIGFFLVVFLGSLFSQFRFTARIRPDTSLLASSFATLGFASILEIKTGILNPVYFFFLIGLLILSIIWTALGDN